jgi:hypothetical protein
MISPDQHATARHHALKREQKNWLTPQKLLMNPMMTKEPLIILRGKKGSQGTGILVSGKVSVVSNFAKCRM